MSQPLDALYRDIILDHYRSPRGAVALPHPAVSRRGANPSCGDELTLALEVTDGVITKAAIEAHGCAISVASASMLTEAVEGKKLSDAADMANVVREMMRGNEPDASIDLGEMDALKGVRNFPVRVKCALLSWVTLEDAIRHLQAPSKERESAAVNSNNGASTTEKPGDARPADVIL